MKITTIKILFSIILVNLYIGFAFGQQPMRVVTGVVEDELGPLYAVNVVEINKDNRIVSHSITDINGRFSLAIDRKSVV